MNDTQEKLEEGEFLEADIENITLTSVGFIIFLKCGVDARVMPIFVGSNEAQSIAMALNQITPPRPMTHDLLKNMLECLDGAITRVEITDVQDNTFFGRIYMCKGGVEDFEFDARPSDAIALAIRWQVPVFVSRHVFEATAVTGTETPGGKAGEKEESPATAEPVALSPLEKLKQALENAIIGEHYEEAARLRDELRIMKSKN